MIGKKNIIKVDWRNDNCKVWLIFYKFTLLCLYGFKSSRPDVFLGKGVLKICSKLTGEHSCRSVISIKLQSNFYGEVALQLYWNHTSAWVFSCQFAAYFQTTFLQRTRLDCCFFVLWKVYNWAQNWLDSI